MSDRVPDVMTSRRALLGGGLGLAALGLGPLLGACSTDKGASAARASAPAFGAIPAGGGVQPLVVQAARQKADITTVRDLPAVVQGMNRFAAKLHRASASVDANWTSSPLSAAVAFGMLRAGARGRTGTQIDGTFGFPPGPAMGSPHDAFNALTAAIIADDAAATASPSADGFGDLPIVEVTNAIFVENTYAPRMRRDYLALLASRYGAQASAVDIRGNNAKPVIDAWVEAETHGRIHVLFDEIDPAAVAILANAVYLKAKWQTPFETEHTERKAFRTPAGRVTHDLMSDASVRRYSATSTWERVSLPYVGDELTMRVVVPRSVATDVATLGSLVPVATASTATDQMTDVDVRLPKWDTETVINLKPVLMALGMTDAFSGNADLTGMADDSLWVEEAVQRANVTVTEEGTEAAAVTGIMVTAQSLMAGPPPIVMTVDRPFVWAIVHEPTGTPVFVGHVVDPTR